MWRSPMRMVCNWSFARPNAAMRFTAVSYTAIFAASNAYGRVNGLFDTSRYSIVAPNASRRTSSASHTSAKSVVEMNCCPKLKCRSDALVRRNCATYHAPEWPPDAASADAEQPPQQRQCQ